MANSIIDMHERAIVENKIVQQVLGVLDDLGRAALRSDRSVLLISNGRFEYGSHKTEATNLFPGADALPNTNAPRVCLFKARGGGLLGLKIERD